MIRVPVLGTEVVLSRGRATVLMVLALATAGCSGGSREGSSGGHGQLVVFAASSLSKAFTKIAADFDAANPGVSVTFDFGSSSDLAAQIESQGAADIFASASETWMDEVAHTTGVSGRMDFATNRSVIITPPSNPAGISSIGDLARPGVQLVLGATGVPVGDYARKALANAGIAAAAEANVVSDEPDDASLVAKITSGEADAAMVYASDVSGSVAAQVFSIEIPPDVNVVAAYPIAVVDGTAQAALARRFIDYVVGPDGQATLRSFGFLPPRGSRHT